MPSWKVHAFSSILVFFLWFFFFSKSLEGFFFFLVTLLFVVVAGIFPDVDSTKSMVREAVSLALSFFLIFLVLLYSTIEKWYLLPILFILVYSFFKFLPTRHRGLTHTFPFSLFFSLVITFVLSFLFELSLFQAFSVFFVILLAYDLHLILDRLRL